MQQTLREENVVTASQGIRELAAAARAAQAVYERFSQEKVDEVVTAAAWAVIQKSNNRFLAELTAEETGLGNAEDKFDKNWRKTIGLLRDLKGALSVGVIAEYPEKGLIEIARPVGLVAAVVPSTSPVAATANLVINALKGRNAIIVSASPSARNACARLVEFIQGQLLRVGAPSDLVQCLSVVNKDATRELMRVADLIVVSGSVDNIQAAHASGTPTISFGVGNVPVILDTGADLEDAAADIARSKSYDNATGCASENSVVIDNAIYDQAIKALTAYGGLILSREQKKHLQDVMWVKGKLNRNVVARSAHEICSLAGIVPPSSMRVRFLMVEEDGIGDGFPFSDEKLSPVLAVYRAKDWEHALGLTTRLLNYKGAGHSIGLYTKDQEHIRRAGLELPTARVIVNQPNILATGGGFDNWMPFTLSIGCGTWGRNGSSNNLTYRDFINITRVVQRVPRTKPTEEEFFGEYWRKFGINQNT